MSVEQEKLLNLVATDTVTDELSLAFWFLSIPVCFAIGYFFHLIGENSRRRQDKILIQELRAVNHRLSKEKRASGVLVDEIREKLFLPSPEPEVLDSRSGTSPQQASAPADLSLEALDDPDLPVEMRSLVQNILCQSCPTCGEPSPGQGYGVSQDGEGCRFFVCSDHGRFEVMNLEEWV